jgi:hypothetical protein
MESTLKRLNPLTNIFLEFPSSKQFNHIFEIISVNSVEDIIQKYKLMKTQHPNHHLIFLFESFRFCLCFVFFKDQKINIDELEEKLKTHPYNQTSVIPGLFASLYSQTVEINNPPINQKELLSLKKPNLFFKSIFGQHGFDQCDSAKDKLKRFLFWLKNSKKERFYARNLPTFFHSNIFGGLVNDLLIKIIRKNEKIPFDTLIVNLQERLDRSKDFGSTKNISLFK